MAAMLPTWAALLIGLGGGVAGGVVTAVLRAGHERNRDMRDRMLATAEAFTAQAQQAIRLARIAIELRYDEPPFKDEDDEWEPPEGEDSDEVDEPTPAEVFSLETWGAIRKARNTLGDLEDRRAAVALLFGDFSPIGDEARGVTSEVWSTLSVVEAIPRDPELLARGILDLAEKHLRAFNREARTYSKAERRPGAALAPRASGREKDRQTRSAGMARALLGSRPLTGSLSDAAQALLAA
jgi:hypothetical protein